MRRKRSATQENKINSAHTRQGILYIIIGLSIASFTGAMMKLPAEDIGVFQITWFRFFGFGLILLPIVLVRFGRS